MAPHSAIYGIRISSLERPSSGRFRIPLSTLDILKRAPYFTALTREGESNFCGFLLNRVQKRSEDMLVLVGSNVVLASQTLDSDRQACAGLLARWRHRHCRNRGVMSICVNRIVGCLNFRGSSGPTYSMPLSRKATYRRFQCGVTCASWRISLVNMATYQIRLIWLYI